MASTKTKRIVVIVVVVVLLGALATGFFLTRRAHELAREKAAALRPDRYLSADLRQPAALSQLVDLRLHTWPRERKREAQRLQARQCVNETTNATTIDLSKFVNVGLGGSLGASLGVRNNTLQGLPVGVHNFAGIPFNVRGIIHLDSTTIHKTKEYPPEAANIPINRRCEKIYLLHAADWCYADNYGHVVGRLVLHYVDGRSEKIDLIAGQHVFDFWMVSFRTGVDPMFLQPAPGTEPAWIGTNPCIQTFNPDESLILYKSVFENPRPDVEISTLDYVSTMTEVSPFLAGLTVE